MIDREFRRRPRESDTKYISRLKQEGQDWKESAMRRLEKLQALQNCWYLVGEAFQTLVENLPSAVGDSILERYKEEVFEQFHAEFRQRILDEILSEREVL